MKSPMVNKRVMNLGQRIFDRMEPSRLKEPFKEYHNQWKWSAQSKEQSIAKANRVNTKSQIRKASKATTTSRIRRHIAWKATASIATRAACLTASSAKPKVNPTRADTTPLRRATKRLPPPQGQQQEQAAPLWPKIISRTFTKITNNEMRFWLKLIIKIKRQMLWKYNVNQPRIPFDLKISCHATPPSWPQPLDRRPTVLKNAFEAPGQTALQKEH